MDSAAIEPWLRLVLAPEIGPILAHRLLAAFGSPEAVFAQRRDGLRAVSGVSEARLDHLLGENTRRAAREECKRAADQGVCLISHDDPGYPELLRRLPNHPLILWARGTLAVEDRLALAIVGPRSPSAYGRQMTGLLAGPLAAHGLTVVSGLAYGIDAEAHRAALAAGGRTLAVVGQGLGTRIYPQRNSGLAEEIAAGGHGALLSVFPMNTEPAPGLFPQRNEVIAALALGTLIVEASSESGALITGRRALACDRVVMACPGDANRRTAQGSNRLIADGAVLVQTHEDVLAALAADLRRELAELGGNSGLRLADRDSGEQRPPSGDREDGAAGEGGEGCEDAEDREDFSPPTSSLPKPTSTDPVSVDILRLVAREPLPVDVILEQCEEKGHGAPAVLERLLTLEIDGRLRQFPGRVYALTAPARR